MNYISYKSDLSFMQAVLQCGVTVIRIEAATCTAAACSLKAGTSSDCSLCVQRDLRSKKTIGWRPGERYLLPISSQGMCLQGPAGAHVLAESAMLTERECRVDVSNKGKGSNQQR
jgi:hypothetical protein